MDMAVESAYLTRLRVAGPGPSQGEINETRTALREGREILRKEGNDRPKLREVIWRLFQDAAHTEAMLPLEKRGSLNCWPAIYDLNEMLKVQWEIGLEVAAGVRPAEKSAAEPRLSITDPTAVRRMLTVFGWLRAVNHRNSRKPRRDKLIVLGLAMKRSVREIKHRHDCLRMSDASVYMIKSKVLKIIEAGLCPIYQTVL